MKLFDKLAYQAKHTAQISALKGAEKTVRAVLAELSRDVLQAVHHDGDVAWANKVLAALTPVNRKVAIAFFRTHLGFQFNQESGEFSKKDKARYEEAKSTAMTFLDDPHNNIWTWAERNIEVEQKEFDLAKLNASVGALTKKMQKANIPLKELLAAAMANGVTIDDIVSVMEAQGYEAKVE